MPPPEKAKNWIDGARDSESAWDAYEVAETIVTDTLSECNTDEAKMALKKVHAQLRAASELQSIQTDLSEEKDRWEDKSGFSVDAVQDLYATWQRKLEDTPEDNLCKKELISDFIKDVLLIRSRIEKRG